MNFVGVDLRGITVMPQRLEMQKGHRKSNCFVCKREVSCLCVNCAMEKVRFTECRKRQMRLNKARALCVEDINSLVKEQLFLEQSLLKTKELIALSKIRREELIEGVEKKKVELERTCKFLQSYAKRHKELKKRCEYQEKAFSKLSKNKQMELERKVTELASLRQQLATGIFAQVFPVKVCTGTCCNYMYDGESSLSKRDVSAGGLSSNPKKHILPVPRASGPVRSSNYKSSQTGYKKTSSDEDLSSKWVILDLPETHESIVQTPMRFTIGGCCVNDNGKYCLKKWLRTGLPELRVYHSAFAAILNAFQLLDVLSSLFDIFLPFQVSIRDAALCEKWTGDLFDTDIFKLNLSVFLISCKLGIKKLDLHRPFANLLYLSEAVADENAVKMLPCPLTPAALEEMSRDYKKLKKWVERETTKEVDGWCMVGVKDG